MRAAKTLTAKEIQLSRPVTVTAGEGNVPVETAKLAYLIYSKSGLPIYSKSTIPIYRNKKADPKACFDSIMLSGFILQTNTVDCECHADFVLSSP